MTLARLLTAAPALVLLAAMVIVLALVFGEHRRLRRIEAGLAERRARPHSVHAGTAAQDAAAITKAAIEEQRDIQEGHAA
ncbi:hypothetical protein [Streptomyces niveus]|uniref:hypothetical protein n=1 Tax=Streptomyces niveus TaxID=193462 RepID=UPI00084CA563|nr:hypothetical protein [Streptomyces niveus]